MWKQLERFESSAGDCKQLPTVRHVARARHYEPSVSLPTRLTICRSRHVTTLRCLSSQRSFMRVGSGCWNATASPASKSSEPLTAHSSLGLGLAVNRLKAQLATGDLGLTLALWMYRRLPGAGSGAGAGAAPPQRREPVPPLSTSAAIGYAEASDPEGASMTFTRLTVRPERLGGVRCVRGLRIPVATVVDMVATVVLGHTLFPVRCRQ